MIILVVVGVVSVFTYVATPIFIRKLVRSKMVGIDVHKPNKPVTAEMGGLVILAGLAIGTFGLFVSGADPKVQLSLLTVILVGLVGVADDLRALRQRYKPFLVGAASVPLIIALNHGAGFTMPGLGYLDYGLTFLILIVPLGVATSSNLTNMLAGFNGLEIGTGSIALCAMTVLAALVHEWAAASVGVVSLAAMVPFLKYNWFPAKVFPGDTGTLMTGGSIATVALMGKMEFAGIICLVPSMIDFALKAATRRPFSQRVLYGDTRVRVDGTLNPAPYPALAHAFLRLSPLTEPELVTSILIMQAIYSIIAVGLALVLVK